MTKISAANHALPIQHAPTLTSHSPDNSTLNPFQASLDSAKASSPAPKRSADEATLDSRTNTEIKTQRTGHGSDGTYGTRDKEATRIGVTPGVKLKGNAPTNTYQSEHVVPYGALHGGRGGSASAKATENQMPAFYQGTNMHSAHAGTGSSKKDSEVRLDQTGWTSSQSYRADVNNTMNDPIARKTNSNLSNAYQLNQLGYAQQVAYQQRQDTEQIRPAPDPKVTDSYSNMVRNDPPVSHAAPGNGTTSDRLNPEGQVEAMLAHETQATGQYPTRERENEWRAQFGI